MKTQKVAVVGSGIAGLSAAWILAEAGHDVSLFEANDYFGGHTHTVDIHVEGQTLGVDTGFLVFNERTYPNLIELFTQHEIPTHVTDMSFSVKAQMGKRHLEWSGSNLDTVFSQRKNLFKPAFWGMLTDILRFNREATHIARTGQVSLDVSLGQYLTEHRYGKMFMEAYLLPMAACIWSCPVKTMLEFPFISFVRFCDNHGLLQVNDRPRWFSVQGGARQYVEKLLAAIPKTYLNMPVHSVRPAAHGEPASLHCSLGELHFDQIILACHSDQSLAMLPESMTTARTLLSDVRYQMNTAVLHHDESCLPNERKAWAAWNYQTIQGDDPQVCVHYWLNRLQNLPVETPILVTLNPITEIRADRIYASFEYSHPVFDQAAMEAQQKLPDIQGEGGIWYAGAWTGYGFHEDGLKSGKAVAARMLAKIAEERRVVPIEDDAVQVA